jgi:SAM-dependent methyltransferase
MFAVAADAYDRFMGRFSVRLAPRFADFAAIAPGAHVLDVGCGPGALTAELVQRVGAANVAAVDPSEPFVAAARERHPDVAIRHAPAERLPFDDRTFDAALAQLVVHFMDDPVAGLREMARVARDGGLVAACVWDHAGGAGPVSPFWTAVGELGYDVEDESGRAGSREGHLAQLFAEAGLGAIDDDALAVSVEHPTFDSWWDPYTLGVGPAGSFLAGLDATQRAAIRDRCERILPEAPFVLTVRAWAARGRVAA